MTKALLFDFGGTLDSCGVPWKARFHRLFEEEGASCAPERFDPAFYAADDALVGTLPRELGLAETVGRLSHGVALRLGVDGSVADRVAARFLADSRACLASSARILERLSRSYRIGIVSNFYGNLVSVCEEAGLMRHVAAAVDSVDVGAEKPEARIFLEALSRLGAAPGASLFVGDSPARDMAGARAAGIAHVLLAAEPAAELCCPGDRAIASLDALEEVLA